MTLDTDILIVGAGLSGLVAAYRVLERNPGVSVRVLEARERVGGRIWTIRDGFGVFDVGPTWFWSHHRHVRALADELGVGVFEQYDVGQGVFEGAQGQPLQRFRQDPALREVAFRLVGGADGLVRGLMDRLPAGTVLFSHQADKIVAQADELQVLATVAGETRRFRARQVGVALPPCLVADTIAFEPPLPPPVSEALRGTQTWMGQAMKVAVAYERPFWREVGLSGLGVSYVGPVQQFHDACPAGAEQGALFGWLGNGSWARAVSVAERKRAVVEQVGRMFGVPGREPIAYAECNWAKEPYTSQTLLAERDHPPYGHPLLQQAQCSGRVHWLSAEVSTVNGGYLDGAIYRGQYASLQLGTFNR